MTGGWSAALNCTCIALPDFAGLPCSENFFSRPSWAFHASALTHRNISPRGSGCLSIGEIHGSNDRRHQPIFRTGFWTWHLAHAAGDHHLRMPERAAEFWTSFEPRLFRPADEPRVRLW